MNLNSLYEQLLVYEIEQDRIRAGKCLELGDIGGYARASLRIEQNSKLLEDNPQDGEK